jgi:RND family efflux transporter MFP subunit
MNKRTLLKILLPVLILGLSIAAARYMILHREPPPKAEPKENPGALVQAITVQPEDRTVVVKGHGTIQPHREINLVPQVSGKIVDVHPRFVAGALFEKGEVLFEIEKIDYEASVEQAKWNLEKARYELAKVQSDAKVAREQWKKWSEERKRLQGRASLKPPNPLVLYEPQLQDARAQVEAMKAALDKAKADLERTRFEAPFNCMVRTEKVDEGQYVRSGESLGSIFGTDMLEVVVPLPMEDLAWIQIPERDGKTQGSRAEVRLDVGPHSYRWNGVLSRFLGEVDTKGRMVQVVVEVDRPYEKEAHGANPDLALGMFVDVSLFGRSLTDVVVIPRATLRDGSSVWLAGENGRLKIQPVQWAWKDDEELWITEGLQGGEKVVLTSLTGAVEGMKLRVQETSRASLRED